MNNVNKERADKIAKNGLVDWYTQAGILSLLQVSKTTFNRWRQKDTPEPFPAPDMKLGGINYWHKDTVTEWLSSRMKPSVPKSIQMVDTPLVQPIVENKTETFFGGMWLAKPTNDGKWNHFVTLPSEKSHSYIATTEDLKFMPDLIYLFDIAPTALFMLGKSAKGDLIIQHPRVDKTATIFTIYKETDIKRCVRYAQGMAIVLNCLKSDTCTVSFP